MKNWSLRLVIFLSKGADIAASLLPPSSSGTTRMVGMEESDNATNCSDGGCSDESYEGEAADFEAGSGFGQQRQYSFFGARHGPPPPR